MINYRKLNLHEDYQDIKIIFEKSKLGVAPEKDTLPIDGWVAENEEIGIVGVMFLYLTSNSFSVITGYPLLNVDFKGCDTSRSAVIYQLYKHIEITAKYLGFKLINTWTGLDVVKDYLEGLSYVKGDECVTQYIKRL